MTDQMPTHPIDAVVTSDDWARDRAAIEQEGWNELPREDDEDALWQITCLGCGRTIRTDQALPNSRCIFCAPDVDEEAIIDTASRIVARLRIRTLGIATGALLALTLTSTHASPADCADNGRTGEGFPQVICADGSAWYLDMDGQIHANAAGAPMYCPGVVWVELP